MSSRTGQAILSRQPQLANDLSAIKMDLPEAARAYMETRNVQAVCSVPLNLRGGVAAAINLYRASAGPFQPEDVERLELAASRIPYLYNSLVNQVGLELLETVTKLIRSASPLPEESSEQAARAGLYDTLKRIVDLVAATFNALECSIYLEDPVRQPSLYRLEATEWPWVGHEQPEFYPKGRGLTGYCIDRQIPVRIFDLGRYQEDLPFIKSQYPDIKWSDPIDLKKAAKEFLKPVGELPPLSFMCAPIIGESRTLGVLRCSVTQTGPHYFDDRQVRFLCMVAERIGEWWSNHIRMKTAAFENKTLENTGPRGLTAQRARPRGTSKAGTQRAAHFRTRLEDRGGSQSPGSGSRCPFAQREYEGTLRRSDSRKPVGARELARDRGKKETAVSGKRRLRRSTRVPNRGTTGRARHRNEPL